MEGAESESSGDEDEKEEEAFAGLFSGVDKKQGKPAVAKAMTPEQIAAYASPLLFEF